MMRSFAKRTQATHGEDLASRLLEDDQHGDL